MTRSEALERLKWSSAGNLHPYSCGIYQQGLMTTVRRRDDPNRKCTCGLWEAVYLLTPWLINLKTYVDGEQ